jgi:SAM-dependent methyltransferase
MTEQTICDPLRYTGERMVPELTESGAFWEHIYRYRFALQYVQDQRVLDIACGEGYGTAALLQAGARSVIGVDVSAESCMHAGRKYGIDVLAATAESIPLARRSIDVIVSFETIEHLDSPEGFLDECTRILGPGGKLIISTPNRDVFNANGKRNPFHHRELNGAEFTALLAQRFSSWELYIQHPTAVSWLDFRALAADSSPWLSLRGMYRLRSLAQIVLCPHIHGEVRQKHRLMPIEAILAKDPPAAAVVNQYTVRREEPRGGERPVYIIAVAER